MHLVAKKKSSLSPSSFDHSKFDRASARNLRRAPTVSSKAFVSPKTRAEISDAFWAKRIERIDASRLIASRYYDTFSMSALSFTVSPINATDAGTGDSGGQSGNNKQLPIPSVTNGVAFELDEVRRLLELMNKDIADLALKQGFAGTSVRRSRLSVYPQESGNSSSSASYDSKNMSASEMLGSVVENGLRRIRDRAAAEGTADVQVSKDESSLTVAAMIYNGFVDNVVERGSRSERRIAESRPNEIVQIEFGTRYRHVETNLDYVYEDGVWKIEVGTTPIVATYNGPVITADNRGFLERWWARMRYKLATRESLVRDPRGHEVLNVQGGGKYVIPNRKPDDSTLGVAFAKTYHIFGVGDVIDSTALYLYDPRREVVETASSTMNVVMNFHRSPEMLDQIPDYKRQDILVSAVLFRAASPKGKDLFTFKFRNSPDYDGFADLFAEVVDSGRYKRHVFEDRHVYRAEGDFELGVPTFVDPKFVSASIRKKIADGWTNLDLMRNGNAPIGRDGRYINLHHILGDEPGPMVELLETTHRKYHEPLHGLVEDGDSFRKISGLEDKYATFRKRYWIWRASTLGVE